MGGRKALFPRIEGGFGCFFFPSFFGGGKEDDHLPFLIFGRGGGSSFQRGKKNKSQKERKGKGKGNNQESWTLKKKIVKGGKGLGKEL